MNLHFLAPHIPETEALIAKWGQCDLSSCDVLVVLGGDGAMLHQIRKHRPLGKPFFGLNFGQRGALMNPWMGVEALERQITQAQTLRLPNLHFHALLKSGETLEGYAINDISFHRSGYHALCLSVRADDKLLFDHIQADGMIVATPLGSHAYNTSAGGPALDLSLAGIVLTPVCALKHQPNLSSWVLNPNTRIEVFIHKGDQRPVLLEADISQTPLVARALITLDNHQCVSLLKV